MTSEWFLRSEKEIKIFFRLDENFIAIKSPGESDSDAEKLSVENARKRWKALLEEGYSQIKTKEHETKEEIITRPKAYWGENSGHYSHVDIPLEIPEWTYRENDENSSSYDSDDYEAKQGY